MLVCQLVVILYNIYEIFEHSRLVPACLGKLEGVICGKLD